MFKKRTVIKILIAVPILWIFAMLIMGFNDNGASPDQLKTENDKIKNLQQQNYQLIAEAAKRHAEERKRLAAKANDHLKEDHDHPEEERIKAEEQQQEKAGPIQVQAPKNNDPNAPGFYF